MAAALPVQLVARAAPDVELCVAGESGSVLIQSPLIFFLAGRISTIVEAQPANAHGLRFVQLAHFPGGVGHLRQLLAAIPKGDAPDAVDLDALDTLAAAEGAGLLGLRKHMPLLHDAIDERLAATINASVASAAEVALRAQSRGFEAVRTRAVARLVEVLQTRSAAASAAGIAMGGSAAVDGAGIGAALAAASEGAGASGAAAGAASAPGADDDDVGIPPLLQAADGGDDAAAGAASALSGAVTSDCSASDTIPPSMTGEAESPVAVTPSAASAPCISADDAARVAMAIAMGALEAGIAHATVFADVLAPVIPRLTAHHATHAANTSASLSDGVLAALVRTVVEVDLRAAVACPQQAGALQALLAAATRRTCVQPSQPAAASAPAAEAAAGTVAVVVPLDGAAVPACPPAAAATRVSIDEVLRYVRTAVPSVAADSPSSSWCSLGLRPSADAPSPLASAPGVVATGSGDDGDDPILDATPAPAAPADAAGASSADVNISCVDGKCGGLHASAPQAPAALSGADAAPLAAYTAALHFVVSGLAYCAAGAGNASTSDAAPPSASARLQSTWSSGVAAADAVVPACMSASAAADWARVVLEVARASAPPLVRAAAAVATPAAAPPCASAPPAVTADEEDEVVAPVFSKSAAPTIAAPASVSTLAHEGSLAAATPLRVATGVAGAVLVAAAERGWGLAVSALLRLPHAHAPAAADAAAVPAFAALAESLLATIADEAADDGIVPRVAADAVFACACWFAVAASADNGAGGAAPPSAAASASRDLFRALAATSTGRSITPALLAAAQQDAFVPIDMLRPFVIHALNTAAAASAAVPASVVPAAPTPTAAASAAAAAVESSSVTLAAARAEMMALLQMEMATMRAALRAETAAAVDAAVRTERAAASSESAALRAEVEALRARVALLESAAPAMSAATLAALPAAERPAAAIGWLARAAAAGAGEDKLQPIGAQIVLLLRVDDAAAKAAAAAIAAAGGFDLAARLLVQHAPTASAGFLRQLAAIVSLVRFRASTTTTVVPTRRAVEAGVLQALLTMGRRFFTTVDVVDSAAIAIWNVLAPTTGGERADARAILLHAGAPAFLGDALRAYGTSGEEKVAQHILLAVRHAVDLASDGDFAAAGVPAATVAALTARPTSAPVASAAAHCIRELAATATGRPQLLEAGADAALAAALAAHAPATVTHKDLQAARTALNSKLASIEAL